MALARRALNCLRRAGEVRGRGDLALIRRRMGRVRRGAAPSPRLVCTDGWCSDRRAMRETVRVRGRREAQGARQSAPGAGSRSGTGGTTRHPPARRRR